ncbi:MAG: Gfo/Idh/MocA family oxidoreductase [Chloroflexota bacterium]|nr:Gfo/Idh/MocA family oxidoreductase [Chloroflexota bacterium]
MRQVRIAIVGCGGVSRMHFEAYRHHPERVAIVAACDPVPALLDEVRAAYGVPHTFASLDDLLAQADFDVAVVCTPTTVRRSVVAQLAAAGKHVFVEKPLADTYAEAEEIVRLCDAAGVSLGVNQNFRYHYPFDIARDLVADDAIGDPIHIVHQHLLVRHDKGWRTTTERHAFSVMGVHWLDGLRWMLRDEAAAVACERRSSRAIDAAGETDITALVSFSGGAMATVTESFSCPARRSETIVIGDKGTLVLTYAGVTSYDVAEPNVPKGEWAAPFPGERKPGATFQNLDLLFTAIEDGTEPANSGHDNLKTIALLDAAYRAAETHETVSVREGVPA